MTPTSNRLQQNVEHIFGCIFKHLSGIRLFDYHTMDGAQFLGSVETQPYQWSTETTGLVLRPHIGRTSPPRLLYADNACDCGFP